MKNFINTLIICIILAMNPLHAKPVHILSIDGGGVRGIIPIKVLSHIEEQLEGKYLTHCFDVMGGTSAGGIIVLLLNVPDDHGQPLYTAKHIVYMYKDFSQKIFYRTFVHILTSINGWSSNKYDTTIMQDIFAIYFKDHKLSDSIGHVIIPSYDIREDRNQFFRSSLAKKIKDRDYYLKDVALATSSAPTYFPPAEIKNVTEKRSHILIDGGVAVNNPSLSTLVHALELYGPENEFIVVSLGTGTTFGARKGKIEFTKLKAARLGKLDWASNIVSTLMEGVNDITHYQMMHIMPIINKKCKYYRLQVIIDPEYANLDNTDPENIEKLEKYAEQLIIKNEKVLQKVIKLLKSKRLPVA